MLASIAAFISPEYQDYKWIAYIAGSLTILNITFHNLVKFCVNRSNEATKDLLNSSKY